MLVQVAIDDKRVESTIQHLSDLIDIPPQGVRTGQAKHHRLPPSIQWFQKQQHLHAHSGRLFQASAHAYEGCKTQGPHWYSLLLERNGQDSSYKVLSL